jgi:5'-3' exonuclease
VSDSPVVLIDVYNVMHRAANSPQAKFTRDDGTPSGILYGTIRTINAAKKRFEVDDEDIILCYDGHSSNAWRRGHYPEYKMDRQAKASVDLPVPALGVWSAYAGMSSAIKDEYEADDVIAYIVRDRRFQNRDTIIVSSDHDMYATLTRDNLYLLRGKAQDPLESRTSFMQEQGWDPVHYQAVLALQGDSSDNIAGVPGVGPTKAVNMLKKRNWDLATVAAKDLKTPEHLKVVHMNYSIMTFRDIPDLVISTSKRDKEMLRAFYEHWQFKSLMKTV